MKKVISTVLSIFLFVNLFTVSVYADEKCSKEEIVATDFVENISLFDEFSSWNESSVEYAYDLYEEDLTTIANKLFYIINDNIYEGYLIVDCQTYSVVEFSVGSSPYDNIEKNADTSYVYIYQNCISMCYFGNNYYFVNSDGSLSFYRNEFNTRTYYPNLQGSYNCIVAAISNIIWHYGMNGYSSLISGMSFTDVKDEVDYIINYYGGYDNDNIPDTIEDYVYSYSSYSVSSYNQWNPTFSNVYYEVLNRPCLLGFAPGTGSYDPTVGHMTMCVGTATISGQNYVKVIDGHSTSIVYRLWGSYNDFMSKVIFS